MIKEAVEELGDITGPTTVQYVHDHFPDDNVNSNTIQTQLIACSVNHTSAGKFDDPNRFLWYLGNGRYRAYDPGSDRIEVKERWRIVEVKRRPPRVPPFDEVPFSRVEGGNRIALPTAVIQGLGLGPNDIVVFVSENGGFHLKKGRLRIEV